MRWSLDGSEACDGPWGDVPQIDFSPLFAQLGEMELRGLFGVAEVC
jgi:hypothetical protein